ncbi:AAA family ATPase [Catalinimonas niigatensis]|uniref:AAA family ATPase n=1 Tax=Catalinimonas niigatensis TaxID=1397264 RepID=UPI00266515FC|nr:AAA family ATPase [Catalinimonas niigatensis]WPP47962.1 AAA family ATPase [Catalinimonas niigatensis]
MVVEELHELLYPKKSENGYQKKYNGQSQITEFSLEDLEKDRVDSDTDVPDPIPSIYVGGKIFCCKGEFGVLGGKQKAGKSSVLVQFAASALIKDTPDKIDRNPISCSYAQNKPVIYIDTEMGKSKTKAFYRQVQKFLGIDQKIPQLLTYSLSEHFTSAERLNRFKSILKHYNDAHLWLIDHYADFGSGVNNEEASNEQLQWLNALAKKMDTTFILVMHENPGSSDKLRGHLGSEGLRKASGILGIVKDKKHRVHKIECRDLRHDEDFEAIIMEWDKARGRLVPVSSDKAEEVRRDNPEEQEKEELRSLAKRCLLDGSERIKYGRLVDRILNHAPSVINESISESAAKRRVKKMKEYGIIGKDEEGNYRLCSS